MTVKISIIGLGQIGTSIGLALAGQKETIFRAGNDLEPVIAHQAEKLGAVDKINYNLPSLVRDADLVILDLPVDEVQEALKTISLDLKEGAVVLDTSPVKNSVYAWAAELLPAGRHIVSWTPAINPVYLHEEKVGIEAAHADLFHNSLVFITQPLGTESDAVKLAADLATLVGAQPFFADPWEVDGLLAASHMLPQLAAAVLVNTVQTQPGWDEGRKLARQVFAKATAPIDHLDESTSLGQAVLLNQDNVLRLLDRLISGLQELRDVIARQDAKELQAVLERAAEGRSLWLKQRHDANWNAERAKPVDLPSAGEKFGQLFGLRRRKEPKADDHK
jgi:prephenate dehydrogenase